jgi:hypothetical protein
MSKRLALIVVLFFSATVAKADNIVSVTLDTVDFGDMFSQTGQELGHEIVGVNFTWDTTTQVLSNFVVSSTGPFAMPNLAADVQFTSDGSILLLNINGPGNSQYQLNYLNHELFGTFPFGLLSPTPGIYTTDLGFFCPCGTGANFELGTATVSAIAAPEPGSAALLLTGLVALTALLLHRRIAASAFAGAPARP